MVVSICVASMTTVGTFSCLLAMCSSFCSEVLVQAVSPSCPSLGCLPFSYWLEGAVGMFWK